MAQHIKVPPFWVPADLNPYCRNWETGPQGTEYPMTAQAAAMYALANRLNYAMAHVRRVLFSRAQTWSGKTDWFGSSTVGEGVTGQQQYQWKAYDYLSQGRVRDYRLITYPLDPDRPGSTGAYAQRTDNAGTIDGSTPPVAGDPATQITTGNAPSSSVDNDYYYDSFTYSRGNAPAATQSEGLATVDDYVVRTVLVQEQPVSALDATNHTYVPTAPVAGDPILEGYAERVRSVLHDFRQDNMPVVACWAAAAQGGDYAPDGGKSITANSGDTGGIRITDTTNYRNILYAQSCTPTATPAFSQTQPGFPCAVRYCGVGEDVKNAGKRLKVQVAVLARTYTAADARIRICGPSGIVPSTGTGDSFAKAGSVMTLTDAGAAWTSAEVGRTVTISGAASAGNDGTFWITGQTATTLSYTNAAGVAETDATVSWTVNNTRDIAITTTLGWHGDATSFVYVDTRVQNNDTSTSRPKIDIWGLAGSGDLYVYGIIGQAVYGA